MSIVKFGIGQITSIEDSEGVDSIEVADFAVNGKIAACKKCGLQYMLGENDQIKCCGAVVSLN